MRNMINAIINITAKIPKPMPALKISPTTAQLENIASIVINDRVANVWFFMI